MGDAGEGLIDADSRIQERMEELERERAAGRKRDTRDHKQQHELETLRLAKIELSAQLQATSHERRRAQISQAIAEIDRRMAAVSATT